MRLERHQADDLPDARFRLADQAGAGQCVLAKFLDLVAHPGNDFDFLVGPVDRLA